MKDIPVLSMDHIKQARLVLEDSLKKNMTQVNYDTASEPSPQKLFRAYLKQPLADGTESFEFVLDSDTYDWEISDLLEYGPDKIRADQYIQPNGKSYWVQADLIGAIEEL
jgi:hypothetical protein